MFLLTEISDRLAESADQDQTARSCSLILLYTLRKITDLLQKPRRGFAPICLQILHQINTISVCLNPIHLQTMKEM